MLRWLLPAIAIGVQAAEFDHSALDGIVKLRVNAIGEVDYAALKADRAGLDGYVRRLAESSPDNRKELFPSRDHELAYWMNAYNALMLKVVVDAYPIASVRKLGGLLGFGVFLRKEHTLGGRQMSLRSLENDIIRKRYGDARIHFAIVCASMSCPYLAREAFSASRLNAQLERLTRESGIFMAPFIAIFKTQQVSSGAVFEWSALVAIAVYALVAWGLAALIYAVSPRANAQTIERVVQDEDVRVR